MVSLGLWVVDVKDPVVLVLPRENVVVEWVLENAKDKLPELH